MLKQVFSSLLVGSLGFFASLDFLPDALAYSWPVKVAKCLRCFSACFFSLSMSYSFGLAGLIALCLLIYLGQSRTTAVYGLRKGFFRQKEVMNPDRERIQKTVKMFKETELAAGDEHNPDTLLTTICMKNIRKFKSRIGKSLREVMDIMLGTDNMMDTTHGEVPCTPPRPVTASPSPLLYED